MNLCCKECLELDETCEKCEDRRCDYEYEGNECEESNYTRD